MSLSRQLAEAISDGTELDPSDDEWLAVAAEVAAADPKRRFSVMGVRQAFATKNGAQYVKIKDEMHRPGRLMQARKIAPDKVRPFFKFVKATKGTGIEFRTAGASEVEVLKDGEAIASIVRESGLGDGSTRRMETSYSVDVYEGDKLPPGYFDTLTAAKKWVTSNLA